MSQLLVPVQLASNERATYDRPYGDAERKVVSIAGFEAAKAEIAAWPGYLPTPLVRMFGLGRRLGLSELHYKDEGHRFGLASFKALGGSYAVLAALRMRLEAAGRVPFPGTAAIIAGESRDLIASVTIATATDGNHGKSVAWGASTFGCRCKIYLHEHVSAEREHEIARFGAEIVRVPGGYDDAVAACARDSLANGWALVADTSDDPDAVIPSLVMQGYTLIADEILTQLDGVAPTHLFVPAGVGGLAAALAGHFWERLGPARPRIIVVEPQRADCVFRSILAGVPTKVPGSTETVMACLAAGSVSAPAWTIMQHVVDDVLALAEEAAPLAMRMLAQGVDGDPPLIAGESGCAATAGVMAAAGNPILCATLGLSENARVVVIGSEGATDGLAFERIVGRSAEMVINGR
ncbi:MAG: diaminopropionate ammonia-lyase [Amaricoccus sp.]|uniref:diaminopropionate ammonia-lyase n=1 Tax=Amaricoccus sp. TaxID=1872485 RepID=UPI0039E5A868